MISLKHFESEIDEVIVDRGLSYWENGNVLELEQIGDGEFEAIVSGSEDYQVNIKLIGDKVQDFNCDCPYDMGPVCKHVVAVLYALKEGKLNGAEKSKIKLKSKGKIAEKQSLKKQFEDTLTRLGKDELVEWMRVWAEKDELFRNYFLARFAGNAGKIDIEKYARILTKKSKSARRSYGIDDFEDPVEYVSEAAQMLSHAENSFSTTGASEIISICFAVIKVVAPALTYSDDSDGEISDTVEQAMELIARTSEEKELSESIKKELFELCLRYSDTEGMDINCWDLDILGIAGSIISGQKEKERLFLILDRKDNADSWHYINEQTAQIRFEVIERLDGKEAAVKYAESMIHLPRIRKQFVEQYIRGKNYSKAKELCEQGIILDQKHAGIVNDWQEYLLTIAEKEKNIPEILRLATLLFLEKFNSKEFYPIIKKYTPVGEWKKKVEFLIQELNKEQADEYITWIYTEEGMLDRLLAFVKENPHPFNIEKFEPNLKSMYPEELKDLYEKAVRNCASHASDRRAYKECCRLLRRMKKLGDKKRVDALIHEFVTTYKKRPAFLDELKRV
jgi:uncharacterized Zn finger protein